MDIDFETSQEIWLQQSGYEANISEFTKFIFFEISDDMH